MQSKKSTKLVIFQKELENLLEKYKLLSDIILFGSFVKGKEDAEELDILLLIKEKNNEIKKIKEDIKRVISLKTDIQLMELGDIYSQFLPIIIREGYSIRKKTFFREIFGIKPVILYKYSLVNFSPVEKVQFTRGLDIMIKTTKSKKLGRCIVIVPFGKKHEFENFLDSWKIKFETEEFDLMPVMRKDSFI